MTSELDPFGPGPTRVTNEWLNEIQDMVVSQGEAEDKSTGGGTTDRCDTDEETGSVIVNIAAGSVISNGSYHEVPATKLTLSTAQFIDPSGKSYLWVYVDGDGTPKLEENPTDSIAWPGFSTGDNFAVLGLGELKGSNNNPEWEWYHDMRRFVRQKSNSAVLVVGDVDAGADFDSIGDALDYIQANDLGGRAIPRRILVTKSIEVDSAIQVRCPGVTIEGTLDEATQGQEILVTWSTGAVPSDLENSALVNVNGYEDVTIRNLHFVHKDTDPWCYIHDPGDRFRLERCIFGEDASDSLVSVAVNFPPTLKGVPEDVEIVDNRAYNLRLGLLGYKETGQDTYTWPQTCLKRSLVSGNHVSVIDVQGWAVDVAEKLYFAIDMGINATECLYNVVADNVIEGCFCGIRAGMFSRVRSNLVLGVRHTGIVATSTGTVPTNPGAAENDASGFTEIYGNHVELGTYNGAPWWRAGIRLEVTSCQVSGNTIVVGNLAGCGIVHGPLDLSDRDSIESHVAALRDGGHAVTGNSIIMNPVAADGTIDHSRYVTRPGTMGIVMLSTGNRLGNNAVLHARTGILVTADCTVCDNVITPAVVAILAWSKNTVGGNAIGWFPHVSQALPWTMEGEPETGAILLSNENTCHGNSIVSGAHDPSARLRPVAINVKDWPVQIFGTEWITKFDVTYWQTPTIPLAEVLTGKRVGGNVITGCVIDLSNPNGVAGEKSATFSLDGIILEGEDASEERGNTVVGTTIRRGERAVVATSGPVTLSSCTCHLPSTYGLHLVSSPRSAVSGSLFHTSSGQAVRVEEDSTDLALNDCLLIRDTEAAAKPEDLACLVQLADRVSVNDCAIVSYGSPGIYWAGDLGLCGGCWFFCHKGLTIDWSNSPLETTDFFPAIRFASTNGATPAPDTQGNLVFGAHMLHCQILKSGVTPYSPIEWSNTYLMYDPSVGPPYVQDNPHPPEYTNGRWTNRVSAYSCYYRYDSN